MASGAFVSVGYNDWFPVAGLSVSAPDGIPFTPGARGLMDPFGKLQAGALTIEQPIDQVPYSPVSGGMVTGYLDDFYNRIYITPGIVEFGAITANTAKAISVWNAYLNRDVTLGTVTYNAAAGLSVTGQDLPVELRSLEMLQFSLLASVQGPSLIDEIVQWVFDIPWTFSMPVTGIRAKTWTFDPDWKAASYEIGYEFLTEIITSLSGREQRMGLRTSPRKVISYELSLSHEEFRQFKDLLWSWQHRGFLAPELTRFIDSTSGMSIGSDTIALPSIPVWVSPGAQVILDAPGAREVRTVDSIAGLAVTFRTVSTTAWPAGTRVHPALSGTVAAAISAPRLTNAVATANIEFRVDPLSEIPTGFGSPVTVFNGREALLKRHNWATSVDVTQAHAVDDLDFQRGAITRYVNIQFGTEQRRCTFVNRNASEAEELLNFYQRMLGRQGEFYMPTWEYDFQPKGVAAPSSLGLRIEGTQVYDCYADSTVHKAVFVMLNDSTVLLRKIDNIAKVSDSDGTDTVITVSEAWGATISQDTIVMCGWLPVWRLVSDGLTMEWITNSVAQTQMTMITLEDLPVETP